MFSRKYSLQISSAFVLPGNFNKFKAVLYAVCLHSFTLENKKKKKNTDSKKAWILYFLVQVSQYDVKTHLTPTLSKSDPEAIVGIVASNIGTEASNILTYHFQPVCSIYLIPLPGKSPLCLRPGVIAAICLVERGFIEEQLQ